MSCPIRRPTQARRACHRAVSKRLAGAVGVLEPVPRPDIVRGVRSGRVPTRGRLRRWLYEARTVPWVTEYGTSLSRSSSRFRTASSGVVRSSGAIGMSASISAQVVIPGSGVGQGRGSRRLAALEVTRDHAGGKEDGHPDAFFRQLATQGLPEAHHRELARLIGGHPHRQEPTRCTDEVSTMRRQPLRCLSRGRNVRTVRTVPNTLTLRTQVQSSSVRRVDGSELLHADVGAEDVAATQRALNVESRRLEVRPDLRRRRGARSSARRMSRPGPRPSPWLRPRRCRGERRTLHACAKTRPSAEPRPPPPPVTTATLPASSGAIANSSSFVVRQ